ncbi:MAG TPA: shikimate dehydrogenase [Rhizomicrobium sp.]|nr:shikimate dehydrogenase [Rhizomicrobium sp.]
MTADEGTRLAGVVGWPVRHSLSPVLHGFWLKAYRIDGLYAPLAVRKEDFSAALRGLALSGFRGVSVTLPHKQAAYALAHSVDADARAAGAVNLLLFRPDGAIEGFNTDALGFAAGLVERDVSIEGTRTILLGAGGAARAVTLALARLGARAINVLNRNVARARVLAHELAPFVKASLAAGDLGEWSELAPEAALVVNATSAGLKGAAPLDLRLEALSPRAVVCDIVYDPVETELLRRARERGLRTVDGLGMLMHQAVPAFDAFFGVRPQVTADLRRELERALGGRA